MTREEAIESLNNLREIADDEVIDMAIEALNDITKWRTWSHTYDNACMGGERSEE